MSAKKCAKCSILKEISDYSQKQGKHELVVRYDVVCKLCRKIDRKIRESGVVKTEAKHNADILVKERQQLPVRKLKREVSKEVMDTVIGQDHLGLNSIHCDVFNEFVSLLRSEFAKLEGVASVFIKKYK